MMIMPPPIAAPHFNNPVHWEQRAAEARTIAEQMENEVAKQMMLGIARDYDGLAVRASIRIADIE
jgi:hypothetical protein